MFGDIKAINAWASSEKKRKLALIQNRNESTPKRCSSGACAIRPRDPAAIAVGLGIKRTAPLKEPK